MRKEDVEIILENHEKWKKNKKEGYQGHFRDADLFQANFIDKDLSEINFNKANLSHSKLTKSKLDKANFWGADLEYSNLQECKGEYITFWQSNLYGANLSKATFHESDFRDSNLQRVDLTNSDLARTDLTDADLRETKLHKAKVKEVKWPVITMCLLASWGECLDELTSNLMLFDASNHPDPTKFDNWTNEENSPYNDSSWDRCALFKEKKELWPGSKKLQKRIPSALELFNELLKEHCILD